MSSYSNYLGSKKCCSNNLSKTVTGPQGAQGKQGPIGPFGNQGATGSQGTRGSTGPCCRGPPGFTGAQGPTGQQGTRGFTGAQGPSGNTGVTGPQGADGAAGGNGGLPLFLNYSVDHSDGSQKILSNPYIGPVDENADWTPTIQAQQSSSSGQTVEYTGPNTEEFITRINYTGTFNVPTGFYTLYLYTYTNSSPGDWNVQYQIWTCNSTTELVGTPITPLTTPVPVTSISLTPIPLIIPHVGTAVTLNELGDDQLLLRLTLNREIGATGSLFINSEYKTGSEGYSILQTTFAPPGANGSTGVTGPQGFQGEKGERGDTGIIGSTGVTGAQGFQGEKGEKGSTGEIGSTGVTGAQGFQGEAGIAGLLGSTGSTGAQGLQGSTGATGKIGATGSTGAIGRTGATGAQGLQGSTGATGVRGATGSTGAIGTTGATGAIGTTGATGAIGKTGATGAQGYQGNTGATGSRGATGVTGTQGFQGNNGTTGVTGSQGLQGSTGSTGAIGTTGATGAQGYQGYQGEQGAGLLQNYYAQFYGDTGTGDVGSGRTGVVYINQIAYSNGMSIVSPINGIFRIDNPGLYSISYSITADTKTANNQTIRIWIEAGTPLVPVPWSCISAYVLARNQEIEYGNISTTFMYRVTNILGENLRLAYWTTDEKVEIAPYVIDLVTPDIPAATITIYRISE